jgi:hypothetical protein
MRIRFANSKHSAIAGDAIITAIAPAIAESLAHKIAKQAADSSAATEVTAKHSSHFTACLHNSKSAIVIVKVTVTIAETVLFIDKLHCTIMRAITTIATITEVERRFAITAQIAAYSYSHRLVVFHPRYFHWN